MRRPIFIAVCLSAASLGLGCFKYAPIARYTFITTDPTALRVEVLKDDASGWFCIITTLLDPLTRLPLPWRERKLSVPNEAFAVEMALRTVPGADVLLDTTFTPHIQFNLLWSKSCVTVTGKAARILP